MKRIISVLSVLFVAELSLAQDIHFTQFNFSPLTLNPGNAGAENDIRGNLNYRNQWASVASPYSTIAASYDMRITKKGDGFFAGGINFFSDRAGDSKMGTTQGNLSLAYHLKLDRTQTLGMGVMGGYAQRTMNSSALMWGNQYDGYDYNSSLASGEPVGTTFTKSFIDLGAGIVWTFRTDERYMTGNDQKGFNVGFAVMHIHQPDYSFYGGTPDPLHRKFVFHGNGLFGISNSRISLAPGLNVSFQGGAKEIVLGTNVRYRLQEDSHFTGFVTGASLSLGAWYRLNDAVALTTMFQFGGYSIGFAYDLNVSGLAEASGGKGGYEIAIRFVYPSSSGGKGTTRFL